MCVYDTGTSTGFVDIQGSMKLSFSSPLSKVIRERHGTDPIPRLSLRTGKVTGDSGKVSRERHPLSSASSGKLLYRA